MGAEDEARAAAYRLQEVARVRFRLALARKLRGSDVAKRVLAAKYQPLLPGQAVPLIGEDVGAD